MNVKSLRWSVKESRRGAAAAVALVVAGSLLAACGGGGGTKEGSTDANGNSTLTILTQTPAFGFLPLQAMLDDGYAAKQKLEINYLYFGQGGGSVGGVFASGSGDGVITGIETAISLESTHAADVKVIGEVYQKGVWVLVSKKGSPYKTLADLKGKTLGISGPGANSDIALRAYIKAEGMSSDDFKIAALGRAPTQLAALENGSAEAVQLQSPVLEQAIDSGEAQVVHSFQTPSNSLDILVRQSSLDKNRVAWEKFMRAYKEAMDKIQSDPAYALDLATRVWGQDYSKKSIEEQLHEFIDDPGVWSDDLVPHKDTYETTTKSFVEGGGFKQSDIPSFESLTKGTDLLGN